MNTTIIRDQVLIVLSKIPTTQKSVARPSSMTGIRIYDTFTFKQKLRPISFLHYPDNLTFKCKKKIILQYFENTEHLEEYKIYLSKMHAYFQYLKEINERGEDIIHTIQDREIKEWLLNCDDNVYTNAEYPLRFIDNSQLEKYLNSFEIDIGIHQFLLIHKRESMKQYLLNKIKLTNVEGKKMFVTNIGNKEYCNILKEIQPKSGLPYYAYDNNKGGYDYSFPPKLHQFVMNTLTANMLAENDDTLKELIKIAKKLKIVFTINYIYHPSKYYKALINCKHKKPLLLLGPTGSGKTFFVKQILESLDVKNYADLNCAVLSGGLFSSKLFGHKKGAFTGADKDFDGFIKKYKHGVILLDEIGELALVDQAKILKYLESGKFYPEGSTKEEDSDTLLIFATNKNLKKMVQEGTFRSDLYYRITQNTIELPEFTKVSYKTKERIINTIVENINDKLKADYLESGIKYTSKVLTRDAVNHICFNYNWPGNIRELHKTLEKTFITNPIIEVNGFNIAKQISGNNHKKILNPFDIKFEDIDGYHLSDLEKNFKTEVVRTYEKNCKTHIEAAKKLDISMPTFYKYLK